jgi:Acetyltransferase (GNAT) domain
MPSHISLFNDERYQRCNLRPGDRLFRYDHQDGPRLVGTLSGVVRQGLLDCGHSAPFGGIDLVHQETPSCVLALLRAALARAREEGIAQIRVRARPRYFGENEAAGEFALLHLGAAIESCEVSLGIEIWRHADAEAYVAALSKAARKTLRHAQRADASFGPAHDTDEWAECYALLAETKRRRGGHFRISFEYVIAMRDLFGPRIAMYSVRQGGELAAAALVYRVKADCDYVVAWGDDLRYRGIHVMNLLAYHLICRALADRLRTLDLGIASLAGVPDDGLIQFKRSLGGSLGLRIDYRLPGA